jgi:hypothetical protein
MKIWILCEHPEGWSVPNKMTDIIKGAFLMRDEAVRCLQGYINIFNMTEGLSLFLSSNSATDEDGNKFYEIVEVTVTRNC